MTRFGSSRTYVDKSGRLKPHTTLTNYRDCVTTDVTVAMVIAPVRPCARPM